MQLTNVSGTQSAGGVAAPVTETSMPQAEAEAIFAGAKAAIMAKDFGAFKALLHSLLEHLPPADVAQMFTDLAEQDVSAWTLGAVQKGDRDNYYAPIDNAPHGTLMAIAPDMGEFKLILIGKLF